jgi:hypothetical protein
MRVGGTFITSARLPHAPLTRTHPDRQFGTRSLGCGPSSHREDDDPLGALDERLQFEP